MAMKDELAALESRVAHIERELGVRSPEQVEADQEAADLELLSRNATTYEEAVAQTQARERQDERDARRGNEPEAAPEPGPEA